jgi:iron complex transport system ATP-binding protein
VRALDVALGGRPVLTGVSLEVAAGSWLAVIGPNGAGKSTLLRAMAGLLPYRGEIVVGDRPVRSLRPRQRAQLVAYAPQVPVLPADMTVADYALLGRSPYIPHLGRESRHDHAVAGAALERLDLDGLAGRRLSELSGGERQRVVLARALAQQTPVLLLDEPTTALDLGHQQQALELADRLRLSEGLTVVTTLHDLSLAAQYADRMILLSGGRVAVSGGPAEVLTADAVAAHFGARVQVGRGPDNRPTMTLQRPERDLLLGQVKGGPDRFTTGGERHPSPRIAHHRDDAEPAPGLGDLFRADEGRGLVAGVDHRGQHPLVTRQQHQLNRARQRGVGDVVQAVAQSVGHQLGYDDRYVVVEALDVPRGEGPFGEISGRLGRPEVGTEGALGDPLAGRAGRVICRPGLTVLVKRCEPRIVKGRNDVAACSVSDHGEPCRCVVGMTVRVGYLALYSLQMQERLQ